MYGNTASEQALADRPVSPVEQAHASLRNAQDELHSLLGSLFSRLDSALRPGEPTAVGAGLKAVDNPAMSELHGQLLARGEQARDQCARVEELLRRLTL